jgi:hypothetical protein
VHCGTVRGGKLLNSFGENKPEILMEHLAQTNTLIIVNNLPKTIDRRKLRYCTLYTGFWCLDCVLYYDCVGEFFFVH